jgi:ribosomal protein S14
MDGRTTGPRDWRQATRCERCGRGNIISSLDAYRFTVRQTSRHGRLVAVVQFCYQCQADQLHTVTASASA